MKLTQPDSLSLSCFSFHVSFFFVYLNGLTVYITCLYIPSSDSTMTFPHPPLFIIQDEYNYIPLITCLLASRHVKQLGGYNGLRNSLCNPQEQRIYSSILPSFELQKITVLKPWSADAHPHATSYTPRPRSTKKMSEGLSLFKPYKNV